jgi:hypothetical protein
MKIKLRNVTVTLEEQVARWARIEAARQDTSVSRLLGAILRERMLQDEAYEKSMRRFPLRAGSIGPAEASGSSRVARGFMGKPSRADEFPGSPGVLLQRRAQVAGRTSSGTRRNQGSALLAAGSSELKHSGIWLETSGSLLAFLLGCSDRGGREGPGLPISPHGGFADRSKSGRREGH